MRQRVADELRNLWRFSQAAKAIGVRPPASRHQREHCILFSSLRNHRAMTREQKAVRSYFHRLYRAPRNLFPRSRERLLCSKKHGVYLIFDPRGRVAHVGRTTRARAGIFQRLSAHLGGRSSFVIKFLGNRPSYLREGCSFSFLEIPNARLRALVEAYATGILCPRHIGTGEAVT